MEERDALNNSQLISVIVPIYNVEHKLSLCILPTDLYEFRDIDR